MATNVKGPVQLKIDERSLRSFKRNCNLLASVVEEDGKSTLEKFCDDVELDAIQAAPTDTGTTIRSISHAVEKYSKGWRARVGVGVKQNLRNPRTGQLASSYAGIIHETATLYGQGEGKFLEKAINNNSAGFIQRNNERLSQILAKASKGVFTPLAPEPTGTLGARESLINAKIAQGFTATRLRGRTLPYPLGSKR